jgi:FAD/FMN-containing dehydrogenase
VGYLSRLHGLTIDNLLAAEIVTADGEIRVIDADDEPDLFWAIRGAGANFGVATRFKFRLRELPEVTGGMLILPATPEVLSGFLDAAAEAPDELSAIVNVTPAPPMPFIPEELQGQLVVMALVCFAGPDAEGERVLAPFRALAEPLADMLAPITYPEIFPPDPPEDMHPTVAFRNLFTDGLDRDRAARLIELLETAEAPMRVAQLRVLGGAIDNVPADETAYAHRGAKLMVNVVAFYESPDERPAREAWVDEVTAEFPNDGSVYVNFMGDEPAERVRAAYPPATWERLAEIKRRYDPGNLFRSNQNIPPA